MMALSFKTCTVPMRMRERGFSLVELLVGVAIALIGIVAMFQVLENWEARKRTTSSGSDAQVSGSIAIYRLERDIRQAGYGFGTSANVGCTVTAYDSQRPSNPFTFPMVPIRITDGAGGAPDEISVLYGSSATMSASLTYTASTSSSKTTSTRTGINRGDLVIVAQNNTSCGLIEITDNTNADSLTINHAFGNYTATDGSIATARFNDAGGYLGGSAGNLYNLGNTPSLNAWQISSNKRILQSRNEIFYSDADSVVGNDWEEVADGIVNLQAEYGLDTDGNTIIDTWQTTAPGTWSQVRAIAVAILARGQEYEKTAVTVNAPVWTVGNGGTFTMTNLDGASGAVATNDPQDWRHYRYRVYETVIPLRNMVWGTAP